MSGISLFQQRVRLRHLHAFVAVAQQGSLGRAALQLSLSQPALSRTLNELDQLAGEILFERDRKGARLTHSGERFLPEALKILSALNQADRAMIAPGAVLRRLHIGVLPTALLSVLAPVIADLQQQFPGLQLQVSAMTNDALLTAMKSGELDVGIGRMADPTQMAGMNFELLYVEGLRLVVSPRHPLLHAGVMLEEVLNWPLILSPRGTVPRQNTETLVATQGLTLPAAAVETLSTALARQLCTRYHYVWFVPYGAVRDDLVSHQLRALPLPTHGMAEPVGILTRQQQDAQPERQILIAALRQRVLDLPF